MRLRERLNAASRQTKIPNPVGLLGDELRHVDFPEPRIRSGGSVVIPGGKRRRRRRRGPVGDTKNDLPGG
jgi:hypothetical protein